MIAVKNLTLYVIVQYVKFDMFIINLIFVRGKFWNNCFYLKLIKNLRIN